MELITYPRRTRHRFTCVLGRGVSSTVLIIDTLTFRRPLTASVDSCTEIKTVPSVAWSTVSRFGLAGRR